MAETPERHLLVRRFFLIVQAVEGDAGLLGHVKADPDEAHPSGMNKVETLTEGLKETEQKINALLASPVDSEARAEARQLIRQFQGLAGAAHILRTDRDRLSGDESVAAFDSELAMLWWDDYPLYRWQMNLLAWRVRAEPTLRGTIPAEDWHRRVLMVARIDGPSPAIARRLIDDAMATERVGLRGTAYIDARGLTGKDGYGVYDANLRDLARSLQDHTKWPTVLDDRSEVFQPGQCPDAALYCGWYSLRKYVPAFTFVRGAVGYHIASAEAVELRRPGETGWCKGLLEDGIAATLGPVAEPYLHAFPLPTEFFGLLMTGQFSLVECYAFTNQFNSWMMMLLGDPLYRPFAANPVTVIENVLPPHIVPVEYGGRAAPPATTTSAPSR
ncbi:MAG: TIGR03790 family protein [Phycisphaerae bacterium]|nr:TIGR03790 family protein [Phycisphaerae bacterium]